MKTNLQKATEDISFDYLPQILLSGDNSSTARALHRALQAQGFRIRFAAAYSELAAALQQQGEAMVLLEVPDADSVEAAVQAALQLKRLDPLQFVGYLADPALHSSGLAGDAIFPRASEQLIKALRSHFLKVA
jgi:PleD family two-component response regulator